MKTKYLLVIGLIGLLSIAGHLIYMKASSGICITELPPKPFVDEITGEKYYIGGEDYKITQVCKGGLLFKFPELNYTEDYN